MKPNAPWRTPAVQRAIRRFMLLMVLLLVPVFVIALFNRPSADDYQYAAQTHAVVMRQGGLAEVLAAALQMDISYYNNWQGLYVSGFILPLQPGIFGNRWYALTTVLVAGGLFLCLWGGTRLVLERLLPNSRGLPLATALLLLFTMVQGMPNQVEGLFWYNGAMNYVPFFSLAVLNAGIAFALAWDGRRPGKKGVLLALAGCVCSLIIGGGHHVAVLLNAMVLFLSTVFALWKRRGLWTVPPLLAAIVGMLFNVLAPGTQMRASGFNSASVPEAFVKSFILAALELVRWADLPLLCFLALLTPLAWWVVQSGRVKPALFRRFWLAPAVTFLLMWGMIFLPSYTMGGIGAGRLINLVWMTFILGIGVSYTALLGWLVHCRKVDFTAVQSFLARQGRRLPIAAAAALLCICCIGGRTVKEGLDNRFATSLEALWELGQGQPQRFAAAIDAREALLSDPAVTEAVLHPLTEDQKAALLFFNDINPDLDWNIGNYYGKDVTVEYAPED